MVTQAKTFLECFPDAIEVQPAQVPVEKSDYWRRITAPAPVRPVDPARVAELRLRMIEREQIRLRRAAGDPRPWSLDPMFENKFTNVRREDDRTTRWIMNNWITPHADAPDIWFPICIARRGSNWVPGELDTMDFPLPWNPEHFLLVMRNKSLTSRLLSIELGEIKPCRLF